MLGDASFAADKTWQYAMYLYYYLETKQQAFTVNSCNLLI